VQSATAITVSAAVRHLFRRSSRSIRSSIVLGSLLHHGPGFSALPLLFARYTYCSHPSPADWKCATRRRAISSRMSNLRCSSLRQSLSDGHHTHSPLRQHMQSPLSHPTVRNRACGDRRRQRRAAVGSPLLSGKEEPRLTWVNRGLSAVERCRLSWCGVTTPRARVATPRGGPIVFISHCHNMGCPLFLISTP